MVLMVLFSSRISPFTSTVIFFDRSPLATAVVTSAILRTCPVRFADLAATRAPPQSLQGKPGKLVHHGVIGALQLEDLAPHVHRSYLREATLGPPRRPVRAIAHCPGQVARHPIPVVGEALPRAPRPR